MNNDDCSSFVRGETIGQDVVIGTPMGRRAVTYADFNASGRAVRFVEEYILENLELYGNTRTEDDMTGRVTGRRLAQAESMTKRLVNAGPDYPSHRRRRRHDRCRPSAATDSGSPAFDRHQDDDYAPYIHRTTDFGETREPLANNVPDVGWVNVVKEHPKNSRLLTAGTETVAFVSLDEGGRWLRLPHLLMVSVDDIVIHPRDNDLILGIHRRSVYILDDMAPLRGLSEGVLRTAAHLFEPRPFT